MSTEFSSAEFFAELEGDATPFGAAPRFMRRAAPGPGDPVDVVSSIRRAIVVTLVSAGYELKLAERIADETSRLGPSIEEKLQTTG